jgi:TPR repeat protein
LGGLKVDYRVAFEWYSKSAKNGNSLGQCNLAWMYYSGNGTKQNYVKAMKWFLAAANNYSHDAQLQASLIYLNGLGVKRDNMMALDYLALTIENGNKHAQEFKDYISGLLVMKKFKCFLFLVLNQWLIM